MRSYLNHPISKSAALRITAMLLGVIAGVIIARLGSPSVKGTASAYAAMNAVAFLVANVDVPQQALRYGRERGSLAGVKKTILRMWRYYFGLGMVAIIVFGLLAPTAVWVVVGATAYLLGAQTATAATGIKGPVIAAMSAVLQQVGMITGAMALWAVDFLNDDGVKLVIILSYLVPLPLMWRHLKSAPPIPDPGPLPSVTRLLSAGLPWQAVRLAQLLLARLDTLFVYAYLGPYSAGIYSVGLSTAELAGLVPTQFAGNTLHRMAQGHDDSARRDAQRAVLAGVLAAALLAAIGWPALTTVYGSEFSDSFPVLLLCLPGAVATGVIQVYTNRQRLTGNPRAATIANYLGLCLMTVGLLVTMARPGLLGVAIASSVGATVTATALHFGTRKNGRNYRHYTPR